MNSKLKTVVEVNQFLSNLALTPHDKFYPNSIIRYNDDLSLSNVVSYLLDLIEEGVVILKYERKVNGVMVDVPLEEIDKSKLDEFYPVFYLTKEYRDFMREKYKELLK